MQFCLSLVIAIFSILIPYSTSQIIKNEIFYDEPSVSINNLNITLGASFALDENFKLIAALANSVQVAMAVCQADRINQKLYPPVSNFNGTINIAVQSYSNIDGAGQYATMQLWSNSLYNSTTGRAISSYGISNLMGFFGVPSSGTNRINSGVTSGSAIPFVNPGTVDQADLEDKFAISGDLENRTYYSMRDTLLYTPVSVVIDLMKYYNWTISGNIFQDNILGFTAQQYIQSYSSVNSFPIFTCDRIFTPRDKVDDNFISEFCKCMTNINTLRVVNMWLNPVLAFGLIKSLKQKCKAGKEFVYIVSGDSKPLPLRISDDPETFKSTLIIRPYGPLNVTEFFEECFSTATPQAKKTVEFLIESDLERNYRCLKKNDTNSNIPTCTVTSIRENRTCLCDGSEYNPEKNQFVSQNFFYPDAISLYASAIGMLQSNCSLVNELARKTDARLVSRIDFCKIKNLTPGVLNGLISYVNFTGYTGIISFPNSLKGIRIAKPFYLYNVRTTLARAVLVGNFSIFSTYLNTSAVLLPSGNDTISKLVPQNPNIDYGSIAFFFGLTIFLIIFNILAFVILIYNINHPLIRRNTPLMSLTVLTGMLLLLIGILILTTGLSDATCEIFDYFTNIGSALMFGGIIAKNYRIYKIFHNRSSTAVDIGDSKLFVIVACITMYFVLLSIIDSILGIKALLLQSDTNPFYLFYQCGIESQFWQVFMSTVNELSLFFLRLTALILAWYTRKVVSIYSESRVINIIVAFTTCLSICFIPLYYALRKGTDSAVLKMVITSIYITLTVGLTLVLLFYYPFYNLYKYQMKIKRRRTLIRN